jgi:hypothetical protein
MSITQSNVEYADLLCGICGKPADFTVSRPRGEVKGCCSQHLMLVLVLALKLLGAKWMRVGQLRDVNL